MLVVMIMMIIPVSYTHLDVYKRQLIMSVQSLLNEYNKRQGVIESNESMLNECISSLVSLKQNLTPEIVEVVNKYNPNLLDLLEDVYKRQVLKGIYLKTLFQ